MRDNEVPFDVNKFISVIKALVHLAEDTADSVLSDLMEFTPDEVVSNGSLVSVSMTNFDITPHQSTDEDNFFLDAHLALLKCEAASASLCQMLGRFDYTPKDNISFVGAFTQAHVNSLEGLIKNFNTEIDKVNTTIPTINSIVAVPLLPIATSILNRLISNINALVDTLNVVIGQHNAHFHDLKPYKVDLVNRIGKKPNEN